MKYLTLALTLVFFQAAYSADYDSSTSSSSTDDSIGFQRLDVRTEMKEARALIGAMKYKAAARKLDAVVRQDYRNADAWNLFAYSNRKLRKFKKADKAYKKALRFDPEHKGALEYQGELFIQTGQLDKAKSNREKLATICPTGCEQLDDLDAALALVKAQ